MLVRHRDHVKPCQSEEIVCDDVEDGVERRVPRTGRLKVKSEVGTRDRALDGPTANQVARGELVCALQADRGECHARAAVEADHGGPGASVPGEDDVARSGRHAAVTPTTWALHHEKLERRRPPRHGEPSESYAAPCCHTSRIGGVFTGADEIG
jgi:hypothetical protein